MVNRHHVPPSAAERLVAWWIVVLALAMFAGIIICGIVSDALGAEIVIPASAQRYRNELTRNARLAWGLDAPIADFAAQIHAESTWREDARSGVGASGMSQFMPATAAWIAGVYPDLHPPAPTNPAWAMRALTQYDRYLYERVVPAVDDCERMAFALSAYNGGGLDADRAACRTGKVECVAIIELPADAETWTQKVRRVLFGTPKLAPVTVKQSTTCACDEGRFFDNVERFNGRRRTDANFRENRAYPLRILKTLSPAYAKANWGSASCSV